VSGLQLIDSYRDDFRAREAYFAFIDTVFTGADFRTWYEQGWWPDNYRPFSLFEGDQIVSNVSACEMTVLLEGQQIPAIQLGAVGTVPEARGRGLSRQLMETVLERYEKLPFAFLFANETVLDFYPKFNFAPRREVVFRTTSHLPGWREPARPLNPLQPEDLELIRRLLAVRVPPTERFGVLSFDYVTAWHMMNVYPNNVFYDKSSDTIWIVSKRDSELHVWDIIWHTPPDLQNGLPRPRLDDLNEIAAINWYFSPDRLAFPCNETMELTDSGLFVRSQQPLPSLKFKFPASAQT